MSEGKEVQQEGTAQEIARASTGKHILTRQELRAHWLEVIITIMLGVVAVATAWSGYQAARWAGVQSARYSQAGAQRVESTRDSTLAGQASLYDVTLFNQWLNAYLHGETKLAGIEEKRFRPEFQSAFEAWLATDPFNNPNAPAEPFLMPQYKVSLAEKADQLEMQAAKTFEEGQAANQQSDDYVFNTVLLSIVLFFLAIAQRFRWFTVQVVILVLALALLLLGLYHLTTYPII